MVLAAVSLHTGSYSHFWNKKNTVSNEYFEYYLLLFIKGSFCTSNIRGPLLSPLPTGKAHCTHCQHNGGRADSHYSEVIRETLIGKNKNELGRERTHCRRI